MIFCIHLIRDLRTSWSRSINKMISGQAVLMELCDLGMACSPIWAKHTAVCSLAPPCTFRLFLSCASSVTRPAGKQFRKLNWLKCSFSKIFFLLPLLHEAALHRDWWEPELTCGQEQQEGPLLYLWLVQPPYTTSVACWKVSASISKQLCCLPALCISCRTLHIVTALPLPGFSNHLYPLLPWHLCNSPLPSAKCCQTGWESSRGGETCLELEDFDLRNAGLGDVVAGIYE